MCLHIDRVLFTEEFTKTLFVQFRPSTLLSRIMEDMRRLSVRPSEYRLNPHMSLMYKHLNSPETQRIAANIRLPMSVVCFDEVWAVVSPGITRTAEDVARWEVVSRTPLPPAT
jgi:hypothetical protein